MDNAFMRNGYTKNRLKRFLNEPFKYPNRFITAYSSTEFVNLTQWVSCCFSQKTENIIALGDEDGFVTIADCRYTNDIDFFTANSWTFQADSSAIMGCSFIPQLEDCLLSISGSGAVNIWNLENQKCVTYLGHEMSVRGFSVWSENPFCVITGSRDGSILVWDTRESVKKLREDLNSELIECQPWRKYLNAHTNLYTPKHCQKRLRLSITSPSNKTFTTVKRTATVTSVMAVDDKYFLSASSNSQSGIRLWDMRYQHCTEPIRTFVVPKKVSRDCGLTSLCWDRFQSRFYATCTDNCIYEYALWSNSNLPIKTFFGPTIKSFYIQCATSPISDHLLCGSSATHSLIYDLQEQKNNYIAFPKFKLTGHKNEVTVVRWSPKGQYIVTIDESTLRIWDSNITFDEENDQNEIIKLVNDVPIKYIKPNLLTLEDLEMYKNFSTETLKNTPNALKECQLNNISLKESRKRQRI